MPLSRHSLGTYPETSAYAQSSQLAEPLLTDRGLKSGISMCKLVSSLKKKKKKEERWRGMNCRTFSQNPRKRGKSHRHNGVYQG